MLNSRPSPVFLRFAAGVCLALVPAAGLRAQAPAAAARQSGTVKAIDASSVTVVNASGAAVSVPVAADAVVEQLAPGVTDLKTAVPVKLSDINVGDKVITGKPGDTATASRVILIKASDIAARNETEQADWQKRGAGGLVKAVDGSAITISANNRMVKIETTPTTVFRRYAADSIKFQDAKAGTLAEVHAGDQLSVRGDKSPDGASIKAEEVVTGTFANLSGVVSAVNAAAGTVTFKDLTTKKAVVVSVTANSDVRKLPAERATQIARMNNPSAAADGAGGPPAGGPPGGGYPAGGRPAGAGGGQGAGPGGAGPGGPGGPGAGRARAGADLSRMLARLPQGTVADLKPNDAVMIVATPGSSPESFTAITLLSGVEQLLTAPAGSQPITLAPWSLSAPGGGGGPE